MGGDVGDALVDALVGVLLEVIKRVLGDVAHPLVYGERGGRRQMVGNPECKNGTPLLPQNLSVPQAPRLLCYVTRTCVVSPITSRDPVLTIPMRRS